MMIHEITAEAGANKRRKRIGRGHGSGHGKTAGRGHKGKQARSGGRVHPLQEGGAMPLFRRLPKRGFTNANFRSRFETVNLRELERAFSDGESVCPTSLKEHRLIRGDGLPVKLLATGTLTKKLSIQVHAVSDAAKKAVEESGGSLNMLELKNSAALWLAKRRTVLGKKSPTTPMTRIEKKKAKRGS